MILFLSVTTVWIIFLAAVYRLEFRRSSRSVKWAALLMSVAACGISYFVWKQQLWPAPAEWVINVLGPYVPKSQ